MLILTLTAAQIWLSLLLFLDWGHGMGRALSGAGSLCDKRREERYASVCAIQRFGAFDRPLRAPFASGYGDLPLPKPVKGAILPSKTPGSGEYRVSRSCPPGSATD